LVRESVKVQFIQDAQVAARIVRGIASSSGPVGFDIETAKRPAYATHPQAGLDPHLSTIRLIQAYSGGPTAYVVDVRSTGLLPLAPLWDQRLVAHNALFELKHLLHAAIRLGRVDCTMLMANAVDGGLPSLQELALTELGWSISKSEQTSNWNAPELTADQIQYAALDAVLARLLACRLVTRFRDVGRVRLYELMRGAQEAIAQLELAGLHFDRDRHAALISKWERVKKKATQKLTALLGPSISPSSPPQIAKWLESELDEQTRSEWPRTKTGLLRTDSDTLKTHASHALVTPLLGFKDAAKRLSGFGANYAAHASPATGRLHASFQLGGCTTGRISSHSPNVQNPPRDPEFRALFSAPADRVLVVADYSEFELRVAALLSRNEPMLDAYARGERLHGTTAAAILRIAPSEVTKDQRRIAKAVNFGMLFGGGAKSLVRYAAVEYGVYLSLDEAERARRVFFERFPGFAEWQRRRGRTGVRDGTVRTPAGRVCRLSRGYYGYSLTQALNMPIQGGAAEVLLAALAVLPRHLDGLDAVLVNVVHDELIVEVRAEEAEQAKCAVEAAMIEGMLANFPDAPVNGLVDAKIGRNWAEAK
jgi:DNA polymerase-1